MGAAEGADFAGMAAGAPALGVGAAMAGLEFSLVVGDANPMAMAPGVGVALHPGMAAGQCQQFPPRAMAGRH